MYTTNYGKARVNVIDTTSNTIAQTINNITSPTNIQGNLNINKFYVASNTTNIVYVIDADNSYAVTTITAAPAGSRNASTPAISPYPLSLRNMYPALLTYVPFLLEILSLLLARHPTPLLHRSL